MNKPQITRRALIAGATVAAVAAGGSAAALATDSAPANVYQGCLQHSVRALYNVQLNPASPPKCLPQDTLISWNQTGPKGDTGPQGPQGETGPAGMPGPKGDTGPAGMPGPKGDAGPAGPAGADGKTVLSGAGAPTENQGSNGDFYIDTSANSIYGPKTDGGWGSATSLVGPKGDKGDVGAPGPQGARGASGAGLESMYWRTAQGTVGDGPGSYSATAACAVGSQVYGGGAWIENPTGLQQITESAPSGDLTKWYVEITNDDPANSYTVDVYALCGPALGLAYR
jgi:hypothetical protein